MPTQQAMEKKKETINMTANAKEEALILVMAISYVLHVSYTKRIYLRIKSGPLENECTVSTHFG